MGGYSLTTKMFSSKFVFPGLLYIQFYARVITEVVVEIRPSIMSASSGSSGSFDCYYQSTINYNDVHLTWTKNEKFIIKYDIVNGTSKEPVFNSEFRSRIKFKQPGMLKLTNINAGDNGTYNCKFRLREYGPKEQYVKGSASCELNIGERPQITVKTRDVKIFHNTSEDVVLEVEVSNTTVPITVNWLHNGKPIRNHNGLMEKMEDNSLKLNFHGMVKEDKVKLFGEYTAVAYNKFGYDADTVPLNVEDCQDDEAPVQNLEHEDSAYLARDSLDIKNISASWFNYLGGILGNSDMAFKVNVNMVLTIIQLIVVLVQVVVLVLLLKLCLQKRPIDVKREGDLESIQIDTPQDGISSDKIQSTIDPNGNDSQSNIRMRKTHSSEKIWIERNQIGNYTQSKLKIGKKENTDQRQKLIPFAEGQLICYGKNNKKQPLIGKICSIGETLTVIKYDGSISGPWKQQVNECGEYVREQVEVGSVVNNITVTLSKSNYLKTGCKKSIISLMDKIR